MGEFDLIRRHFSRPPPASARHIALGVGDDAALLRPAPGMALAISCDMLVAGRHFFADTDACGLGHKALAVNLSDCSSASRITHGAGCFGSPIYSGISVKCAGGTMPCTASRSRANG